MGKNIVFILLLVSVYAYSADAFDTCKQEILSSEPYGSNARVELPKEVRENENEIIFDWPGIGNLTVLTEDGVRSMSVGRCIYDKTTAKVTFLSIYSKVIISRYKGTIARLKNANAHEARDIVKQLGLSDVQINWLKLNSAHSIAGFYNPDGKVIGIVKHGKNDLEELDALQIINLYTDKYNDNQYECVSTDISKALAERL